MYTNVRRALANAFTPWRPWSITSPTSIGKTPLTRGDWNATIEGEHEDEVNDILSYLVTDTLELFGEDAVIAKIPSDWKAEVDDCTKHNLAWDWLWQHLWQHQEGD